MTFKQHLSLFFLILFLIFNSSDGVVKAQESSSLITLTAKKQVDYPEMSGLFNKLTSKSDFVAMHFAEFCDWESCLSRDDYFTISLFGKTETWMPSNVEEFDDRVYYGGHFNGETGNLSVVDYGDRLTGSIAVDGKYYQIFSLDNREVILLETRETTQTHGCESPGGDTGESHTGCYDAVDFCPAVARVLFLTTPEALNIIEDEGYAFGEFVDLMTAYTNEALVNSGLVNKRISSVFHPTPITQISEPTSASDLTSLNNAGTDVFLLREEYEADIVFLYVEEITNAEGVALGIGVGFDKAYAMGEVFWDLKNGYNLHHELGHLWGGHHQPGVVGSTGCNAAHDMYLITDDSGSTVDQAITAIWSGAGSRDYYKKHFSNPYVTWQGYDTGIHGARNNALFIDDHFCDIANFYPNLDFAVDINVIPNGEDPACPSSYTLTADITTPGPGNPGQPSYELEWRLSRSPFFSQDNPGSDEGSAGSIVVDDPMVFFNPDRYVKLTVTAADGFDLSRTKKLNFCTIPGVPIDLEDFRLSQENSTDLMIYPNPADIDSKIFINGSLSEKVFSVEVVNSKGMLTQNIHFDTAQRKSPFPSKSFRIKDANGLLFLLLKDQNGNLLKTEKIFVK